MFFQAFGGPWLPSTANSFLPDALCVYAGQKWVQIISFHTLMACDACYV